MTRGRRLLLDGAGRLAARFAGLDVRQYLGHFAVVVTGTMAAQVINLAAYPAIARLYSAADFGLFALFIVVTSVIGAVAGGRFELTIPTVPYAARFAAYWLAVALGAGTGVVSAIVLAALWLSIRNAIPAVIPLLAGLAVFLTAFCAASSMFLFRYDRYGSTSSATVTRTAVAVVSQVALAFLWPGAGGLILGFCLGFVAQAIVLIVRMRASIAWRRPRLRQMRTIFLRYRRQVSADVPGTLVGVASVNLINAFLLILFSQATVGIYALANRIAIAPLQLFNDSLSQVFFQKAAKAQQARGTFWTELKFSLSISVALSLVVLMAIYAFARPFIHLYIGAKWRASGDMLVVLAPLLALQGMCMSIATSVFVLKRAHWLLLHNLAIAAVQTVAFAIAGIAHLTTTVFLLLVVIAQGAEYAVFVAILVYTTRRRMIVDAMQARQDTVVAPADATP